MINLRKNLGRLQFVCLHGQIYYLYHVPFLLSRDKEVKKSYCRDWYRDRLIVRLWRVSLERRYFFFSEKNRNQ